MKLRNKLLIGLTLVSAIMQIIGLSYAQPEHTPAIHVSWSPSRYTLDNPVSDPWIATLFAPANEMISASDINASTIRLDGMYRPLGPPNGPYLDFRDFKLVVPFDGYDVLMALLLTFPPGEITPGTHPIELEITGQTYSGTPFRSSSRIILYIPRPIP